MGGIGQQFARSDGGGNRPSGGFDSTAFRALELPGLDPKPQGPGRRRKEPKSSMPMLLAGAALLVVGMIVLVMMTHSTPKTDADDRGMAVFHAADLRGHMVTRWNGKAQYQLKIDPVDPEEKAQFAYAAANPPGPMYVNIRMLDQAGFALCGKQVLFAYDPARNAAAPIPSAGRRASKRVAERIAREQAEQKAALAGAQAQEQTREQGNDIFQNELGDDGSVIAVNVQGSLPCSRDQYKKIDYWDFATNFPTVEEQDALLHHKAQAKALAERRAAERRKAARTASAFYIEGEDRISLFDASRESLAMGDGKSFYIPGKPDQGTAISWAANSSLIHYKCDQRANCSLKHAGSTTVIYGRLNE